MTIKLIIADDHAMIRAGLRLVTESADGIDVVGEAADGNEAVALALYRFQVLAGHWTGRPTRRTTARAALRPGARGQGHGKSLPQRDQQISAQRQGVIP
ncbi:response regulator transcription factor [Nonomuraea spiralis]|uniref:response regulator transcription factor n=1 Tax=Nonomuraea TaxID=83681 RepID=UPI000F78F46E|nr:response regulator transcription factor [Nonomuraea sp. WAC 01424]RSN09177.1 hypothetical protein DMB42_17810 [Nonomuraea sp. WAC 01424]